MCGIAGVYLFDKEKNVVPVLYDILIQEQKRGELSAGIATYHDQRPKRIEVHRELGLVNEVFRVRDKREKIKISRTLRGFAGLGQVRYATSGKQDKGESDMYGRQPFESQGMRMTDDWIAFGWNGNISNQKELYEEFKSDGAYFPYEVDTELIRRWLRLEHDRNRKGIDLVKLFSNFSEKFKGAYSLAFLNAIGELAIVRDPFGVRPLCYGHNEKMFAAASESTALESFFDEDEIFDVQPGELLIVSKDGIKKERFSESKRVAHCMFEYVYFSSATSTLDGMKVRSGRENLGGNLVDRVREKLNPDKDFVVVPVPFTSIPAAQELAKGLGLEYVEALERNEYVGRTFTEEQHSRDDKVEKKYKVHREKIEGKKVILVDDSAVRGTTGKKINSYWIKKKGGAKEVHNVFTCPMILDPCYFGMDMPTYDELIAARCGGDEKMIAEEIGANTVTYQTLEGLIDAVGLPQNKLCLGCLTGNYPEAFAKKRALEARIEFEASG